ncbi:MAG: HDOD domain-containing protein [Proteobacteria bacterium]|nr:HDOD domain-containing protein [Pseudomonadota bacterium]MBU1233700.1 HDOD domain-containing protein [Pseudomonadota bacterium]MBU1420839.1 HDOD domain-containing protein [Pseudomonadota bacterium]
MDTFLARQPIFDRKLDIYGYELLFRADPTNIFPEIDGDSATAKILSSTFFTVGIEEVTGGKKAFVNFTEELLLQGTAHMFSAKTVVIELLENISPSPAVIEAMQELRRQHYDLALDDFSWREEFVPLLQEATIIKVDFQQSSEEEIRKIGQLAKDYGCFLLAEKIETYKEFNHAKSLGFRYFQGYFFSRPEMMQNKDISPMKQNVLHLLMEVFCEDCSMDELEAILSHDVAMSFKLLNYINSAAFFRVAELHSVRQAIAFLGINEFRIFVTVIAVAQLCQDKPHELFRASVIRARFLSLLAIELGKDKDIYFMLGLFSLIDAMLDNSMEILMKNFPVSDNLKKALTKRRGELFSALEFIELYEQGEWDILEQRRQSAEIDEGRIASFYLEAITWADNCS